MSRSNGSRVGLLSEESLNRIQLVFNLCKSTNRWKPTSHHTKYIWCVSSEVNKVYQETWAPASMHQVNMYTSANECCPSWFLNSGYVNKIEERVKDSADIVRKKYFLVIFFLSRIHPTSWDRLSLSLFLCDKKIIILTYSWFQKKFPFSNDWKSYV